MASHQADTDSLERVKAEVSTLIEPYRHSTDEPPFSTAELAVIAVLLNPYGKTHKKGIVEAIVRTFPYFNNRLIEHWLQGIDESTAYEYGNDMPPMIDGFDFGVFDSYDVPICEKLEDLEGPEAKDKDELEYVVSPSAARLFLSQHLDPKREGSFRFLDLPAEIRNVIYGMVLQYPKSGFALDCVGYGSRYIKAQVLEREASMGRHQPGLTWRSETAERYDDDLEYIAPPPMQTILALLSVNKQVNAEAMPVFYGLNHFRFKSATALRKVLEHLPQSRLRHVQAIEVEYGGSYGTVLDWVTAMRSLNKLTGLKSAVFEFSDELFLEMNKYAREALGRKTKFTKIAQIPGIAELASFVAGVEKVEFVGECPKIKEYLEGEAARLKIGGTAAKAVKPRKRKAKVEVKGA